MGLSVGSFDAGELSGSKVLVVGRGGGKVIARHRTVVGDWLRSGGDLLAVGLDQEEVNALPDSKVVLKNAEHIAAFFNPPGRKSLLAGISPADVHNRDPREIPLVVAGAEVVGDGVLAISGNGRIVLCQIAPWDFAGGEQPNLRRTRRRLGFMLSRLLANMGAASPTPLIAHFRNPPSVLESKNRCLTGFYLDQPEEWDDPYRFFRW
jgi:hypothetical protein